MRAIARTLNVPLGTVFNWIRRYGRQRYARLVDLWVRAEDLVGSRVFTKVVDEMWTRSRILGRSISGSSLVSSTVL
jgi:hypothetical protein